MCGGGVKRVDRQLACSAQSFGVVAGEIPGDVHLAGLQRSCQRCHFRNRAEYHLANRWLLAPVIRVVFQCKRVGPLKLLEAKGATPDWCSSEIRELPLLSRRR